MLVPMLLTAAGCAAAADQTALLSKREVPPGVPAYVVQYAPMVYLHSQDPYLPADIGTALTVTQPEVNYTVVSGAPNPLTLDNLNELNSLGNSTVYLTSIDDITTDPAWLHGTKPDSNGETQGTVSCAIIVNDHGNGQVDAFYMYFYAFDYGGVYLGLNIGDHVGDWEHNMVRFNNGTPRAIWYSQHSNGEAFTYDAVEKYGGGIRPVGYSANGTHANYAINGTHDHAIPDVNLPTGLIQDYTDNGPVWDPTLSAFYFSFDAASETFTAYDNSTPVNWLYFFGHWGDQKYPESDSRQECYLDIEDLCKYSNGPTGPIDKQLNRTEVCPDNGNLCIVRTELGP